MRMRALFVILLAGLAPVASAQVRVEIPRSDGEAPLVAYAFVPQGEGRHPAVVMAHGCGGAYARDGSLNARHRMWGELLAQEGYVAILVDSFTSRGLREVCTQKMSDRTIRPADRAADAFDALAWIARREDVDPARVALLGWSHGGSTALETVVRDPPGTTRFAAAVAFYPGCSRAARNASAFDPRAPLLILIGEADDWTPAEPCHRLADAAKARGKPVEAVFYPGAYHDFDNPGLQKARVRKEVPNGVKPGQGVTVAPDPAAREDAKRRVAEFLSRMGATSNSTAPGRSP